MQVTLNDLADNSNKDEFWKENANMYNIMSRLESHYSKAVVEKMDLKSDDRVLDLGCGVGRLTKYIAPKVKEVVGVDFSSHMLEFAKISANKYDNIKFIQGDFFDTNFLNSLGEFEVVLCSRIPFLNILKDINTLAKRLVYVTGFANAPNFLSIKNELFNACHTYNIDRLDGYNIFFNTVYEAGFDVSIILLKDGLYGEFASNNELIQEIAQINTKKKINEDALNKYISVKDDKIILDIPSKSFLMWWYI